MLAARSGHVKIVERLLQTDVFQGGESPLASAVEAPINITDKEVCVGIYTIVCF